MLSNPGKLAKTVIDIMEDTDTGGTFKINDPNNGFVMQLLASVSIYSAFSQKVDHVNSFFYPQRARTAEQLYSHLSEFDYVKLMASPATLPFVFAMSKDWIIANGVYYDDNYNKITIPPNSFITMGGVRYSMYHGIDILINRNTGAVTAFYDTTVDNALNVLPSNMLKNVQEYVKDGISYFQITFNMYQFARDIKTFTTAPEAGFIQTLVYEDQFYAVKVFTQNVRGGWDELQYSLTQLYYDYQTPTAVLTLMNDQNKVRIEIPQIYFDNNQISKTVRVELYSTKGAVNYQLSLADVQDITANFDPTASQYTAPMAQMPTWVLIPAVTEVYGGSNVMPYDEIREAVVKQRLYNRVAVTTPEIIEAGKRAGFDLTRVTDDLTERVYYASNILTDSNEMVVPTFAGNILMANESLEGNPETIIKYSDGYYTILPTTPFKISKNGLTCTPLTNGQVAALAQMTTQQQIAELNKGIYVRQPFHITLLTSPKSPQALVYNLLAPTMNSLTFVGENAHSAPQMSATDCRIVHLNNGTGGYQVVFSITRSSNITTAIAANFAVIFSCATRSGEYAYIPATFVETDEDGRDVWAIQLATSYHIGTDDFISVLMYNIDGELVDTDIRLNTVFSLTTCFVKSFDRTVPVDPELNLLLPPSLQNVYVAMARQDLDISLGQNLSGQIYCGVNTSWGNDVYDTADETIYHTTNVPIFQTDETGLICNRYNPVTRKPDVIEVYPQGSTPSATNDLKFFVAQDVQVPSSGTTTNISLRDIKGLLVGGPVRGLNIPAGASITALNGNVITINRLITAPLAAGTELYMANPKVNLRTSVVQAAPGDIVKVPTTAQLIPGQSVFGFDVPKNAKVKAIVDATTVQLTIPTTKAIAQYTLLTFINTTAPGVVKTMKGEIITDPTGQPIVVKSAQNQYLIPSVLFDGRLFASDNESDQLIVSTIAQRLQTYANQISTIDAGLIEDSNVFYKPSRTMGYANFGVGAGKTINMPLELSFTVYIYVDVSVYNTQTLLSTIDKTVIAIINKSIQNNIISVSDITDAIKDALGTNVTAVEMGPISGRDDLRLISLQDAGSTPSIENLLYIETDGTVGRKPNITIVHLPKPDTSVIVTPESMR
jgi:hypothetical protein